MRILAVHPGPFFSVHDVYVGWSEALLEVGAVLASFNLDERMNFYSAASIQQPSGEYQRVLSSEQVVGLTMNGLLAACYKLQPDVLLVVSAFFVPVDILDLIRSHGTRIAILHTEEPYEHDRQINVAAHADVNLVNDPINLPRFQEIGPAAYMPHCYRPSVHYPGPGREDYGADVVFVGTGYPSRIEFLEKVDFGDLSVTLAGNWQSLGEDSPLNDYLAHEPSQCLDNGVAAELYRSSHLGLQLYRRETRDPERGDHAAGWATGPREIEMAAVGLPFLREPRGESDELFPMLPTFTEPAEVGDLLRWWLDHDDEREAAARKAQAAIADRTFTRNAQELLRLLDAIPGFRS